MNKTEYCQTSPIQRLLLFHVLLYAGGVEFLGMLCVEEDLALFFKRAKRMAPEKLNKARMSDNYDR
jgi:hypothetical protein